MLSNIPENNEKEGSKKKEIIKREKLIIIDT
jgi:hypothetical protein